MFKLHTYIRGLIFLLITVLLTNCGSGSNTGTSTNDTKAPGTIGDETNTDDEFSQSQYNGLHFYYKSISPSEYKLKQLDDSAFNALNASQQLQIANKLLSTLFYGIPLKELQEKIDTGSFIDEIRNGLNEDIIDKERLEDYILDEEYFHQGDYNEQVAIDILSRFYAMEHLDSYFLKNWVAYILTQTIMFSPAYELESAHTPNIARVYNRLVTMLEVDSGMRYITYVHMMSEDNWRRFRSPEDNGREMLEIYTLDMDDSHVPIAGKALKNWKLDTESDTLVVSLNQNRESLKLFGTTIVNGDDFYRELAKSSAFTKGVTTRLVSFFFPNVSENKKIKIINSIIKSKPETWQDILLQIVFSEEYLLNTTRTKSAEELFYSMAKKIDFNHNQNTFYNFKNALEEMHQASMKYKLGKLKRVPIDTLSFANYHKYFRERMFMRHSNPDPEITYEDWGRQGWSNSFIDDDNYNINEENGIGTLKSFISYLFNATISRKPSKEELSLFTTHMVRNKSERNTTKVLDYAFNLIVTDDENATYQELRREDHKETITRMVLDYISRLAETYMLGKVK